MSPWEDQRLGWFVLQLTGMAKRREHLLQRRGRSVLSLTWGLGGQQPRLLVSAWPWAPGAAGGLGDVDCLKAAPTALCCVVGT